MKFISTLTKFLIIPGFVSLASCSMETPWGSENKSDGKILLYLNSDESVNFGTRADNQVSIAPSKSDFSIALKSTDGSYNETWKTLADFEKEDGFPMGSYMISASYGSMNEQGFDKPYFFGQEKVNVTVGNESKVSITTTLANAMLSIRYDENFKKFFKSYSATVTTENNDPLAFIQGEERPAYISTGNATINLSLEEVGGYKYSVNPTKFVANPKTHHIVTFKVEGNVNGEDATLTVEWSDKVVEDSKTISLDKLKKTPAPEIQAKGYSIEGETRFEGIDYSSETEYNPEFHVIAMGGIESALLNIKTEDGKSPIGSSVELANASPETQSLLKSSGLDCAGIFNPKTENAMAVINFKDFIKNLTPGTYEISLVVKDTNEKLSDSDNPVKLKVKVIGINYEIVKWDPVDYLSNEIKVYVGTNCEFVKDQLLFQSGKSSNTYSAVKLEKENISSGGLNQASTDYEFIYSYILPVEEISASKWYVRALLEGKTPSEKEIDVIMPDLKIETDPFAKKVKFRVTIEDSKWSSKEEKIFNNLRFYSGNTQISSGITRNNETKIILLTEDASKNAFTPNTDYNNFKIDLAGKEYSIDPFKTEEAADVPNGNFSNLKEKPLSVDPIQIGSPYRVAVAFIGDNYKTESSILRDEPELWANLNQYTCYENSQNINTWYLVPSTYSENNITTLRTVGFNHNGKNLNYSLGNANGNGNNNTHYYGETVPENGDLQVRSGELFLGSYTYDGSEEQSSVGINFNSRPSKFSFDYSYMSYNGGEKGNIILKIKASDGKELATYETDLGTTEEWKLNNNKLPEVSNPSKTIDFDLIYEDEDFNVKASTLEISFKSTKDITQTSLYIPTGDVLDEGLTSFGDENYRDGSKKKRAANSYHAFSMSAELKISNLKFKY